MLPMALIRKLGRRSDLLLFFCLLLCAVSMLVFSDKRFQPVLSRDSRPPCLILDPGHGGIDGGAVSFNGIKESDINLAIGLRLRSLADFCGVETCMTRTDDSRRTDILAYSEHEDLVHRTELINAVPNGILISIHQNTFPTTQPRGAQVLYAAGEQSRRFGELTHQNLIRNLQPENRRVAEPASKRLYITSHVTCPAILVECGFLSNYTDLDKLCDAQYQLSLATVLLASYMQFNLNDLS